MRIKKTVQEFYLDEDVRLVVTTTEYEMLPCNVNPSAFLEDNTVLDEDDFIDDEDWMEDDEEYFEEDMEDEE